MGRIRFSLFWLFVAVFYIAITIVGLINASGPMASIAVMINYALLLAAILGVILCRGERQAFAIGFAIFAGGYLLLCFAPLPGKYQFKESVDFMLSAAYPYTLRQGTTPLAPGTPVPGAVDFQNSYPVFGPTLHDFLFVAHVTVATLFGLGGALTAKYLIATNERKKS